MKTEPKLAVIMITLNESHNLKALHENIADFADEVFVLDSFSSDNTVSMCLEFGWNIAQRPFDGFGSQWNAALSKFSIASDWVMKVDPDERLSNELKNNIKKAISSNEYDGFYLDRRLWFMGEVLPIRQRILRVWRKGKCVFSDSLVNEYPLVDGPVDFVAGCLEHHDSPHMHHWLDKQNSYSSAEAKSRFLRLEFAFNPRLFGTNLERRMWIKKYFSRIPFRFFILFVYYYFIKGLWKAGHTGYIFARLRADVYRYREYKLREMHKMGGPYELPAKGVGPLDERVKQF